ncbi:hypothetical protein C8J98_102462 [Luteibacter sp. OK325]|uniref:hypothetical protein n=1 Tax=Luteibacter sp. OK325 TaxID=2135670 RepID=UPI000D3A2D7E|nr:hypothetical protein [Luteibacter sp. OK325]PTR34274.1 hypothetical protein C8J98_102462 [Luteibacter sp. OK325]
MPSRLNMIAVGLIASVAATAAVAQAAVPAAAPAYPPSGAPAGHAPTDPQFEAAKNFISFYTFNRVAYKQVCDKQAVDVSAFVNTFVNENAGAYARTMSVLQAHGLSEAKVMARLQATIASSEPDVRKALEDSAVRENAGSTTLDGCKFLAAHGEKLATDLDLKKSHPEVIQALNGAKP